MHPALWISKTGLDSAQTDISTISNNLANANTVAYKKGRAVFESLLYQNIRQPGAASTSNTELPTGLMMGTGAKAVATQKSFAQGNLQITENSLDVAIQGRGFFEVLLPDGSSAYTRAGNFALDDTGQMVTAGSGYVVQPAVTIPQDTQSLTVGNDGTISVRLPSQAEPSIVGQIQLSDFINPAGLQPIGENLYIETGSSGAPISGTPGLTGLGSTIGGALEASNVSSVEELVSLIESQRIYEMNAKVISAVDSMMQFVNQTL